MVIILILGVLWGLVLAPSVLRKFKRQASHQSIDSFHHSLHTLEHSGPKLVEPAYRLVGGGGGMVIEPTAETERPRLVLLRPPGQGEETTMRNQADDYADEYADEYADAFYDEDRYDIEPMGYSYGASRPSGSYGRRMAARRRRTIVLGLAGTVVVSGLLGVFLSFFFVVTALAAVALVAYVGLMSYVVVASDAGAEQGYGHERHVAHATAWQDESTWAEPDGWETTSSVSTDDGWWDEPRRAVAR